MPRQKSLHGLGEGPNSVKYRKAWQIALFVSHLIQTRCRFPWVLGFAIPVLCQDRRLTEYDLKARESNEPNYTTTTAQFWVRALVITIHWKITLHLKYILSF